MKYARPLILLAAFIGLWVAPNAPAFGQATRDLPDLLLKADVVCVGKVGTVRIGKAAQFGVGVYQTSFGAPAGTPPHEVMVTARRALAQFTVERFLKGIAPSPHLQVTFPAGNRLDPTTASWYTAAALVQGERVILFLTRPSAPAVNGQKKDPQLFSLFAPFSVAGNFSRLPGSKIVLGSVRLPAVSKDVTPLRRTLRVLAAVLSQKVQPSRTVLLDCLFHIENVADVLSLLTLPADVSGTPDKVPSGMPTDRLRTRRMARASLGETPSLDLDGFAASIIVPAVERLLADPDPIVRKQAVLAAAALQDEAVIPQVAQIARGVDPKTGVAYSYEVAEAVQVLGDFCSPASVHPLTLLLTDTSWKVREQAASALRVMGDPRSVPALLNGLGDANPDVRYMVVTTLYASTGDLNGLPSADEFHKDEGNYIGHWKRWGVAHQAEVNRF